MPNLLGTTTQASIAMGFKRLTLSLPDTTQVFHLIGATPVFVNGSPSFGFSSSTGYITNPTLADVFLRIDEIATITPVGTAISAISFNQLNGVGSLTTSGAGATISRTMALGSPNNIATSYMLCLPPNAILSLLMTQVSGSTQTANVSVVITQMN